MFSWRSKAEQFTAQTASFFFADQAAQFWEVIVDTQGHLGTVVSSERFKDKIQPKGK
jgi:hypothetical protein